MSQASTGTNSTDSVPINRRKTDTSPSKPARRRRRKTQGNKYDRNKKYSHQIHKLLQCVCPDLSISVLAMNIMNSFTEDLLERIAKEASHLVHYSGKSTMGYNDIIAATKLVVPSEMNKYPIQMANSAVRWTEN